MRLSTALLILFLSGCAIVTPKYEEPLGVDTANLTVENTLNRYMFAHAYKNASNCQGRSLIGFLSHKSPVTVKVSSTGEFSFSFNGLVPQTDLYCEFFATFTPMKGNNYYSTMQYDYENKKCLLVVNLINSAGSASVDVKIKPKSAFQLDENSAFCVDK